MRAYKTAAAFREALKARLRALAKDGPWEPQQLQRQLAYDRLLERLYLADDGWIVKGAVALLARDIGVRASLDVDIYRATATEAAESELRAAAARDVGDWFRFDVPDRQMLEEGYRAEAGRSLLPVARELDGALAAVRPFLDPLLDGSAAGTGDHVQGAWVG